LQQIGGGIYYDSAMSYMFNVSILQNIAPFGGGIYTSGSTILHLVGTSIQHNSANQGGGYYCSNGQSISISGILNNSQLITMNTSNIFCNQSCFGNAFCLEDCDYGCSYGCPLNEWGASCQTCDCINGNCSRYISSTVPCVCDPGFDSSKNCTACLSTIYGPNCSFTCSNCLGASYCDSGLNGTGACICSNGKYNLTAYCLECINGYDITTECTNCTSNFYGANCTNLCIGNCNNGFCSYGINGTGECICYTNYDLLYNCTQCTNGFNRSTNCIDCISKFYGVSCSNQCPECYNGYCSNGTQGTGECVCVDGFDSATNCLTCLSGFDISINCSDCLPLYYGKYCSHLLSTSNSLLGPIVGATVAGAALFIILGVLVYRLTHKVDKVIEEVAIGDNIQTAEITTNPNSTAIDSDSVRTIQVSKI